MKPNQSSLEDQIARLPDRERARLALRLLESLEVGRDEEVDELWLDEAERRLTRYDAGESKAVDADDAVADIERHL